MPRKKTAKTKKIQIGDKQMSYGRQVTEMIDSNDLYDKQDFVGLRQKLEEEGFLFIRGVIPSDIAFKARTAMLNQALKDKSITIDDKYPLNHARISRKGTKWSEGYCLDAVTGCETNERANIDTDAWEEIGPSPTCQAVYNGPHLQTFWKSLFGPQSAKPLVKQTFLRLMGSSGTVQHADYYYFKRDTHIFSGDDGIKAQKAATQYLTSQNMWQPELYEVKDYEGKKRRKFDDEEKLKETDLVCNICNDIYDVTQFDEERKKRWNRASNKDNDFGMEGTWHCPKCAAAPLSIYTTWMSLSQLNAPRDSILAMAPKTHLLQGWDLPKANAQVPRDFNWKLPWVIPKSVDYGDIIIFNIKTIHASSLNTSTPRSYRCSFDTRLQLLPAGKGKEKMDISDELDSLKL
eukprot:264155_1